MLAALIASLALWALTTALLVHALVRGLERQRREFGRREDLLVNQLCHALDRPWQQAPADAIPDWEKDSPDAYPDWQSDPEQALV